MGGRLYLSLERQIGERHTADDADGADNDDTDNKSFEHLTSFLSVST